LVPIAANVPIMAAYLATDSHVGQKKAGNFTGRAGNFSAAAGNFKLRSASLNSLQRQNIQFFAANLINRSQI
jgi:hypothetical protein